MTTLIMPMAGEGNRVKDIFDGPKPLLPILNYPMFYWSIYNINIDKKIFIVRNDHIKKYKIDSVIKYFFQDAIIVVQNGKLNGPVESTLLAREYIDEDPILICDCDMYSEDYNILDSYGDGNILTFNNNSNNYSYILKKENYVEQIVEKKVISNDAVGGKFYWKSGNIFLKYADIAIKKAKQSDGEVYMSNVYREAINDNLKIYNIHSDKTYDLSIKDGIKNFIKDKQNAIS